MHLVKQSIISPSPKVGEGISERRLHMTLPCNGRGSVLLQGVRASALLTETVAGAHAGFFNPLGRGDLLAGAVADALDHDRAVARGDSHAG